MDFISFKVDTSYGEEFFFICFGFFLSSLVTALVLAAWVTRASLTCSAFIGFKSWQRLFSFPGMLIEVSCVFCT